MREIEVGQKEGYLQTGSVFYGSKLYFNYNVDLIQSQNQTQTIGSYLLGELDLNSGDLRLHQLRTPFPFHLALYNGQIYISHRDIHGDKPRGITVFDPETNTQQFYATKDVVREFHLADDLIYTINNRNFIDCYRLPQFERIQGGTM